MLRDVGSKRVDGFTDEQVGIVGMICVKQPPSSFVLAGEVFTGGFPQSTTVLEKQFDVKESQNRASVLVVEKSLSNC